MARRTAVTCAVLWIMAVFLGLGVVQRHAETARVGYDLAALEAQAAALEEENHALKVRVASLESPGRIYQIATSKLGMVRPKGFEVAAVPSASGVALSQPGSFPEIPSGNWLAKAAQRLLVVLAGPARAEAKGMR